ncbi:hypothetical protein MB84_29455 (plasmid) [Pandoraea oxalativorans]|uniref:Uncharacterized protein n=1 Tax=Pandoraea oxalativorans TaxID=573737 RepID=A0A0G3IEB6_9BURK|nr:hypothetical protein MB84_29455 [Pandoraea oxalativorans]
MSGLDAAEDEAGKTANSKTRSRPHAPFDHASVGSASGSSARRSERNVSGMERAAPASRATAGGGAPRVAGCAIEGDGMAVALADVDADDDIDGVMKEKRSVLHGRLPKK